MAVPDIEAVLDFLRKNGFSESESALMEDIFEKSDFRSFDFEKFLFPMVPPPPPLKIPAAHRRSEALGGVVDGDDPSSDSSEEFMSLGSFTSDLCASSEFRNPYGIRTATQGNSQASSDRLSEFGTAHDCYDFDMQNDHYWYNEKDEDYAMPPCFGRSDSFGCASEDKFVMTLETEKQCDNQLGLSHISEGFQSVERTDYLDKTWPFNVLSMDYANEVRVTDYYHSDEKVKLGGGVEKEKEGCAVYSCSAPLCTGCVGGEGLFGRDSAEYSLVNMKGADMNDIQYRAMGGNTAICDSASEHRISKSCNYLIKRSSTYDCAGEFKSTTDLHIQVTEKGLQLNENDGCEVENGREAGGDTHEPEVAADEEEGVTGNEILMYDPNEDEYEVFNLRIIHRKNRTGFEENKDLPIVLNSIIAGRYYVTEYLGSAAFSKVVQAHDLLTGIDVCLKIIKNDKDFFDQSLDEIKLLKFVNKHDPGDEHHILRLYDYFYFQEHLFIVCELLRANLYEFQKYNRESGGEPYFTLSRLQVITRQCLEALEFLHQLGIIHCDLKPENILIKSYRRCEIKVIDLGSSCFQTDNLCLYVQSRSYRAPEVILGLPYDQKIDLWSLGCILAELCSGEVLFPNDALVMLLARMIGLLGPIDVDMLVRGQETPKYFTEEYDLYHVNEETDQLEYIIPEESSLEHHLQVSDTGFIDFLRDLLEINPDRRPTAREALEHPWLSHQYEFNSC
uniref:Putative dual specificity protein kinase CLK1 isoform X1 n=2 Tax=Davidia involucrata TaxID=16924 RepID=A0A5B6YTI5_DAVIN